MPEVTAPVVAAPAPGSMAPEAAKAKALESFRAMAAEPAVSKTETTPPVTATPAKIEMDPETLKTVTKLSSEAREWKEKHAAIETETKTVREAAKLYKEGKRIEAIALLSGQDATVEMDALLSAYLDAPAPEAKPESKTPEQIKIAELEKKLADREAREAKQESDTKQANARAFASKLIDPTKFPVSAKEQNKTEAADAALSGAIKLAAERNLEIDKLSDAQCAELISEAMKEVESDFVAIGQRYSFERNITVNNNRQEISPKVAPVTTPEKTVVASPEVTRPGIVIEQGRKNLSLAEAKERAKKTFLASLNS